MGRRRVSHETDDCTYVVYGMNFADFTLDLDFWMENRSIAFFSPEHMVLLHVPLWSRGLWKRPMGRTFRHVLGLDDYSGSVLGQ